MSSEQSRQPADGPPPRTQLESPEEIRDAIRARRGAQSVPPVAQPVPTQQESTAEARQAVQGRQAPPSRPEVSTPDAPLFRPVHRPAIALLYVIDDGGDDGECIRVRDGGCIIGRDEGDVVIPHDDLISSRHAQLARVPEEGRYRWYLIDLQSKYGSYLRVSDAKLKPGQELLLGGRHYRFDAASQGVPTAEEANPSGAEPKGTRGWQSIAPTNLFPSLVELTASGAGQRVFLSQPDNVLGRDAASCAVVFDDPLLSQRHARICRDAKGRWHIQNLRSVNGTWLRVERAPLDPISQFQLGEQRFLLRVL